jgi:uncharacterized membrane protein YdjX (TVP38/TMEM64 family)
MSDPVSQRARIPIAQIPVAQIPIALSHPAPAWRRALLFALACAALALIAASPSVHEAIVDLLRACEDVIGAHPLAGPAAFMLLAAASAMLAFVSVAVLVPIAVFAWGPVLAILYLWSGWLFGGILSWVLGRFVGRSLLLWLSPAASTRLDHLIHANSSLGLALLLQLSLPSELLGYALGSARFGFRKYLFVLAAGELPYAIGAVALGESFVARRSGVLFFGGIVIGSLIILAFTLLRSRVQTMPGPVTRPVDSNPLPTATHH